MNETHILIRLLRMYIPRNWEFGSGLVKLWNFGTPLLMDGRYFSYLRSLSKKWRCNRNLRPPLLGTPMRGCRKHGALILGRYLSHCDDFLFHIMPFLLGCYSFKNCVLRYRDEGTRMSLNIDEFWGCGQYQGVEGCCKEGRIGEGMG
jgi:hypothetical protein